MEYSEKNQPLFSNAPGLNNYNNNNHNLPNDGQNIFKKYFENRK